MTTLTQKTFTAAIWNFTGTFGNQAIQFTSTLVLARLLSPAEFGLVAMLMVFTLIAAALIDSGFGAALIQMQQVTRVDESAVFYVNLLIAAVLYAAFWWLAIPIAGFYQQPALIPIARVLSLIFLFNAFGLVQSCLFTKQLNFRVQTRALMLASTLSGLLGITMAYLGYGVWSLVALSVSNAAIRSGLLWAFSSWRPLSRFNLAALRPMWSYGSRLLASGLLGSLFDNLFPMMIGKFFSKIDVGYYTRAQLTQRQAADSLTGVIINVSFPAYASIRHHPALLREGYRRSIVYASVVLFPLMLGLAAMATPVFLLLFSEKWAPSIPYFQVLCLSGMLYHVHALNLNVLKATGRSDLYLRLSVIKVVLAITGVMIAYRFGMLGIVWGQVIISWLGLAINTLYTGKIIQYTLRDQLRDIWPYIAVSAGSAGLVFLAGGYLTPWPLPAQVGVLAIMHGGLYIGFARLFRLRGPFDLLRQLRAHVSGVPQKTDAAKEPALHV